jgi:lipopolysaccharide transport system ATP-binding protein
MRVRLAFAVAAHLEPDILVVDEVLAVGDAEFQKKAIGKMKDISGNDGRTVLFVSHNMAAVKSLCTRGIVLENGTSVFEGTAEESVDFYLANTNSNDEKQLKYRTDRIGNTENFMFTDVKLLNKKNNEVSEVISGEFLKIKLKFDFGPIDLSKMIVTVGIRDKNDELAAFWTSDELGFELVKTGKIQLIIPKIMLRGGIYNLWLFSSYETTMSEDLCDVIGNVKDLLIIPADYWSSGKLNRTNATALIDGFFS